MKNRILKNCAAFLLAIVMCIQITAVAHAISVKPEDTATKENVLEVLRQYDAGAYHIMTSGSGTGFMTWFMGGSIISGIDTAVHETYHGYTHSQNNAFYGERIYLGNGKSYDVDYSVVYNKNGTFTKTEEMSKQIPSQLQTFRYEQYVAPGARPDANTKGVFGLLNEFTAYYWGLETMNSLARFLSDTEAGADAWGNYVTSIGNNMTAYAEFKYWTLRYMLYIQSANPTLYQAILDNQNYCAAYRDADAQFVSEIARSRKIVNDSAEYMRSKGFSVDWSDSGIYLQSGSSGGPGGSGDFDSWLDDIFGSWGDGDFSSWGGGFSFSGSGLDLGDYNALMAELGTAEYINMDSVLKNAGSNQVGSQVIPSAVTFSDVPAKEYYANAVKWAVEKGITNGTTKTTFSPDQTCTQVQILTLLYRTARGDGTASAEDLNKAVSWARERGMIDASFNENAPCTRSSVVKFIWQAFGSPAAASSSFTDVPAGIDYAQAVDWALANGITNGTSTTTFGPSETCTRGQIVTFLHRAYVPSAALKH